MLINNIQSNIKLRSQYRNLRHKLWKKASNDEQELNKCNLIKNKILELESNNSRKFYRYKSFYDWDNERFLSEIDCLRNKKLTLISPSLFNDPYDCRFPIKLMSDTAKIMSSDPVWKFFREKETKKIFKESGFSNKDAKKKAKEFTELSLKKSRATYYCRNRVEEIRKKIPIVCFSTRPDDMYFWSHYGGNHRGFCIEYTFNEKLFNEYLHPVEYTESWPSDFDKNTKGANISIILVKSLDWLQELEWRMSFGYDGNNKEIMKMPYPEGLSVSAVYFGLDFHNSRNQKDRDSLIKSFDGVDQFNISLDNASYKLRSIKK